MPKFNEVLSNEKKYVLSKSIRMMDIMRGVYYSDADSWIKYGGKGVVTQHVLGDKVRLVHCYNYNKYTEFSKEGIKLYIVVSEDEPIGLVYLNNFIVCKFIPNQKYISWNESNLCKMLNKELEGTTFNYACLSDSDKSLWVQKYSYVIFKLHLEFNDSFIAELWKKMDSPLTKEQLIEYKGVIYEKRDLFSSVQKDIIAQELIFYVLPQYISKCSEEEYAVINELCQFLIEEYNITIESEWDEKQILSHLEGFFLINSIEKAKEYYIANDCSLERYKDCCMDVDYKKIMDSFEQWDISSCKQTWAHEALERLFAYNGTAKDWNIERILKLLDIIDVELEVFVKLKKYICIHIDEIYVREAIIFHMQQMMLDNMENRLICELLEECCEILQGFESRELSLGEKESLRKAQNNIELSHERFNYINEKEKVIIIKGSSRIHSVRDIYVPRYEEVQNKNIPCVFEIWDADGLIGKLEVVEYHIIWNVIGIDREKLIRIFSQYVRNLEIISPETEIRYATNEEAEFWDEKTIISCIQNEDFFERHSEWFVCNEHSLDTRLMKGIVKELRRYEEIKWMHNRILIALIFYVLPSVEKNPNLCTQQELRLIGNFMEKATNVEFQNGVSYISSSDLVDNYNTYCHVNSMSTIKRMYELFNCKKSRYLNGKVLYYSQLWEEFNQFDITPYQNEWTQEIFDKEIERTSRCGLSSCFILDLLELVGSLNNYQRFIAVYEKYSDKQYILFRLEKIMKHVTEEIYYLLNDFYKKLKKEICVEEN